MSPEGLQQEVCAEDRFTATPPERTHEAEESPLRLLQQVLCQKRYPSTVSLKFIIACEYTLIDTDTWKMAALNASILKLSISGLRATAMSKAL
jgi:hypothetical protein